MATNELLEIPVTRVETGDTQQTYETGFERRDLRNGDIERLSKALGWFSIGLGLAEVLVPNRLARLIGVNEHPVLFRVLGVRELVAGAGVLMQKRPAAPMWSRVAGDMMDLGLLLSALGSPESDRGRVTTATAAVAAVTALDLMCSRDLSNKPTSEWQREGRLRVRRSIAVNRPPAECYRFWRDLPNLGRFMTHIEEVHETGERTSHWVAKGPAGSNLEWDAEITEDTEGQRIAWQSQAGADLPNRGLVVFEARPNNRGTMAHVEIDFEPPAGYLGLLLARAFGENPERQIAEDLRRFKRMIETGEVPTTKGQSAGRSTTGSAGRQLLDN